MNGAPGFSPVFNHVRNIHDRAVRARVLRSASAFASSTPRAASSEFFARECRERKRSAIRLCRPRFAVAILPVAIVTLSGFKATAVPAHGTTFVTI